MAGEDARQPSPSAPQESLGNAHVPGRLRDLLGSSLDREVYLSTEEAAQYVGRPSREAFIKWARRHNIPMRRPHGGRTLAIKKSDLDWALRIR